MPFTPQRSNMVEQMKERPGFEHIITQIIMVLMCEIPKVIKFRPSVTVKMVKHLWV